MHNVGPVLQVVEENQIKIQDIYRLLGCDCDPQDSHDHRLSQQKGAEVDKRQARCRLLSKEGLDSAEVACGIAGYVLHLTELVSRAKKQEPSDRSCCWRLKNIQK